MNEIERIALWTGLFSSIVGSVLAVVAMIFTWVVNKRTDRISDRTLQSLDKIEATIANVSEGTNSLIKAAWDKMLGNVGPSAPVEVAGLDIRELAAGIAAEIREDLGIAMDGAGSRGKDERLADLERSLERLEAAVQARAAVKVRSANTADSLDFVRLRLRLVSPEARALIGAIRQRHLTVEQYRGLQNSPLAGALSELRDSGLLAPLVGEYQNRMKRVYFIPPGLLDVLTPALALLPPVAPETIVRVEQALSEVGYGKD